MPTPAADPAHSATPSSHAEDVFVALQALGQRTGGGKLSANSPLAPYHTTARWIYCGFDLFTDVPNAILAGIDKENPQKYTQRDHQAYAHLYGCIPQFAHTIAEFRNKPECYALLATWMSKWADGARNEDMASLKKNIPSFMALDPDNTPIVPPLPENKKEKRGLNHPMIARLLIPRALSDEVDKAGPDDAPKLLQEFITSLKDGDESFTHIDLPTYLYDETVPYDEVEQDGLLRGHCLLRAYRCLMTGPSSAISGIRTAAKKSKAEIHGLTTVTAKTLAYMSVMVRQSLSSTQHWTTLDGTFDYKKFYQLILHLLKDENERWCKDLLAFWNEEVPELQRKSRKCRNPELPDDLMEREKEFIDTFFAARRQRPRRRRVQEPTDDDNDNDAESEDDAEPADDAESEDDAEPEEGSSHAPEPEDSVQRAGHKTGDRSLQYSPPAAAGLPPQLSRQQQVTRAQQPTDITNAPAAVRNRGGEGNTGRGHTPVANHNRGEKDAGRGRGGGKTGRSGRGSGRKGK